MHSSLERLWWSRLVISVRGYVVNYVQNDDEILFHTDDAFISIHRFLAEEKSDKQLAQQSSFVRVFGQPNDATYRVANERWMAERKARKSIRFETDPEWQPDDRVVLFQEFYKGNRTWVLLDFDRYVLAQWRPRGSEVIFGARFVEKKMRAGMQLCAWCGMIEQQVLSFSLKMDFSSKSTEHYSKSASNVMPQLL
ncbi:unnamed protein product [Nippostrongylus brasiliensis]|uniref:PHD finger protein 10 n=1 Tax=Nippostrongylus brasiliensis TaxID=27835 RepID=A0A0N4Y4A0_NIPBR|nr:unnamed protein product [Nippostrongylus brasiliensis]